MIRNIKLPKGLVSVLGSENRDFEVKADRAQPLKKSIYAIVFGMLCTAFISSIVVVFLGPIFMGKEVHFEVNGVPTVAGPDNLGPIIMPAIFIGIFLLVGISILVWGIYSILNKGGYFVGTPTRLVHYQKGNIRSIDWEQFSGDIEVNGNTQKGNISLQMRTGRMVHRSNNRSDEYVPDVIYITGIPNVFEIEKICRTRIKENDPTPPASNQIT